LLGVVNGPVADFIFRRIAKPKAGGYFEANKQFIAPLAVPDATPPQRAAVAVGSKRLQELHSARRYTISQLHDRLSDCQEIVQSHEWLWSDLQSVATWKQKNPQGFKGKELTAWAKCQHEAAVKAKLTALGARLTPRSSFQVRLVDGVLYLDIDGTAALHAYMTAEGAAFWLASWSAVARTARGSNAKTLVKSLLKGCTTDNRVLRDQLSTLNARCNELTGQIHAVMSRTVPGG